MTPLEFKLVLLVLGFGVGAIIFMAGVTIGRGQQARSDFDHWLANEIAKMDEFLADDDAAAREHVEGAS